MSIYQQIYDKNKSIDATMADKFENKKQDILLKNMIKLIVKFSDLASEIKSFKYSTYEISKEKVLERFSDVLMMTLFFANILDMTLEEKAVAPIEDNINKQILYLFQLITNLNDNYTKDSVSSILVNLIYLAELLELTDDEIYESTMSRIALIEKRIEDM